MLKACVDTPRSKTGYSNRRRYAACVGSAALSSSWVFALSTIGVEAQTCVRFRDKKAIATESMTGDK
jgi:hypothetical protein